MRRLAPHIVLREVGLRDALQATGQRLSTAIKCDWVLQAQAAGVCELEVGACWPGQHAQGMADTLELVAMARSAGGLRTSVCVLEAKGARAAWRAGADVVTVPLSVSATHAQLTTGLTREQAWAELQSLVVARDALRREGGVAGRVEVVVGAAFGCRHAGPVSPEQVMALVDALLALGVDDLTLADSFGLGRPDAVFELFARVRDRLGPGQGLGAHLHQEPGGTLGNVLAAAEVGVARFDVSLAGIGGSSGCPESPGNVSLAEVAQLLGTLGISTGVDVAEVGHWQAALTRQGESWRALRPSVGRASVRRRLF